MTTLFTAETGTAFLTLALLEIVLGVDNVIFLTVTAGKLPADQRPRARLLGLAGAMGTRILLLIALAFLARLTATWITILGQDLSGRDFILLLGGLFLMAKSTLEIHEQLEGGPTVAAEAGNSRARFLSVILQITVLDIVFSLDSVITAVGMTNHLPVMIAAIVAAVIVMMFFSGIVARVVENHPTIRTLALSFLILIGMSLVAESLDFHVPKGYLYFAMAFSTLVEVVNLRVRKRAARTSENPDP